jgi:hypothetical protein
VDSGEWRVKSTGRKRHEPLAGPGAREALGVALIQGIALIQHEIITRAAGIGVRGEGSNSHWSLGSRATTRAHVRPTSPAAGAARESRRKHAIKWRERRA